MKQALSFNLKNESISSAVRDLVGVEGIKRKKNWLMGKKHRGVKKIMMGAGRVWCMRLEHLACSGECRAIGWREKKPDCEIFSMPDKKLELDPAGRGPVSGSAAGEKVDQTWVLESSCWRLAAPMTTAFGPGCHFLPLALALRSSLKN